MPSAHQIFGESCSESVHGEHPLPGRILVAEDNPSNQLVATYMLENIGYQADVVNNGAEAIEALKKGVYDVVLMDCQMPEMDGFEATKAIRESEADGERHISIIAMTAFALKGDREKCLDAGMDDYISKPVAIEVLKSKIEAALLKEIGNASGGQETSPGSDRKTSIDFKVIAELQRLEEDGASNVIEELSAIFLSDSPMRVDAIRKAIAEGDADALEHSAHAL